MNESKTGNLNITDLEARETLEALSRGEIDAFVVSGPGGERVFTLESADYPYRIFVETMNEGAVTLNKDGAVVFCNTSMQQMLGLPHERVIAAKFSDFVSQTEKQPYDRMMGNPSGEGEFLLKMDHKLVPAHISSRRLPLETNHFTLLVVTDLSHKKYQAIVEDQTELICRWNRHFVLRFVNDAFCGFFGKTREELIGKSLLSILTKEDQQVFFKIITDISRDNPVLTLEMNVTSPHGIRWLQVINRGIFDNSGIIEIQSVFRDITERKNAEESLRESETRYESLANNLPSIMVRYDRDLHIQYLNSHIQNVSGIPPERYIGKSNREIGHIPEDICELLNTAIKEVFQTGLKSEVEYSMPSMYGVRNYSMSLAPEFNSEGTFQYVLGISTDITNIKQAEAILQRDNKELERLVEERSRELEHARRLSDIGMLSATVAHEMRNPLAAMAMAVANIRRKAAETPSLTNSLDMIDRKVKESNQIINNLLFYSRLRQPHYKQVNTKEILEEAINISQDNHAGSGEIAKDIEALDLVIDADSTQLSEVFLNILNNSYDAVQSTHGSITVTGILNNDHVIIEIEDTGIGIGEKDLPQIMQPFYTTKAKGTGLGLTVTQQIIQLHGGEFSIESDIGKGTTVTIKLPQYHRIGHE